MKNVLIILSIGFLFSACKKDQIKYTTITKDSNPEKSVADSSSITIDGKSYLYSDKTSFGAGNRDANKKLDSVDSKGHSYFSGDNDSLLYSKTFTLLGGNGAITFSFVKKYARKDLLSNKDVLDVLILAPADDSQLYAPGNYNIPLDFDRENAHNGVVIEVKGDEFLTSYDQTFLGYKTNINPNAQSGSEFKIISLKKDKKGGYLIEANFHAILFNGDENQKKVENGYLRMHVE